MSLKYLNFTIKSLLCSVGKNAPVLVPVLHCDHQKSQVSLFKAEKDEFLKRWRIPLEVHSCQVNVHNLMHVVLYLNDSSK